MRTAKDLRKILGELDYQALNNFSEDDLASIIDSDDDEMHPAHSILAGIVSLRHNPKETSTEETDIEKAYKCIKILTQKYPPFLELVDDTGNTLSILYVSQDITAKEAVLKLLLDPEVNITKDILDSKNNPVDKSLPQYSLAELISKDADFIIPKINSLEVFERFKALGIFSVNSKDSNGKTILHHEFALSSFDVFDSFVEMEAELVPDSEGKTPYNIAKATNRDEIVHFIEELVSKNFENRALTNQKLTSQEALEVIAVHGFDAFIDATGRDPSAFLLKCSEKEKGLSAGLLDLLIKHGAEVNAKDNNDRTPLHLAASNGYREAARLLIASGAHINAKDINDRTPLQYAVRERHTEVAKLLIDSGADLNTIDDLGGTPLHWAAIHGYTEVAKFLIEHRADVNAENNNGATPLQMAAILGYTEVAKLLIDSGADVNTINYHGATPLHGAASHGYTEVAKFLIEHEADVNAKSNYGETPLHNAARHRKTEVAKLLIDSGADVNAQSKVGGTPLHSAAFNDSTEVAKFLIEHEADVNAKDEDGRTPLHWAATRDGTEVAKFLIEHGADVNAKDKGGETPLQCAVRERRPKVADLLRKAEKESTKTHAEKVTAERAAPSSSTER